MEKIKLYCFFTPSHRELFDSWLKPSAEKEYILRPIAFDRQISDTASYRESGWRETQYHKVLAWINAIKENMGDIIICSDTDVQFLRPSSAFLVEALGSCDIAFQQNNKGGKVCSGFFVCRCSLQTLNFMEIVAKRLKRIMNKNGGGEQYVMWSLLKEDWLQLKVVRLSYDKVWTPGRHYQNLEDLDIPKDIMIHHANWTEGRKGKASQLNYVKDKVLPYAAFQSVGSISESPKKSKIAVCSSSILRGLNLSTDSLIKNIIHTLPCKPDFIGNFTEESQTEENLKYLDLIKKECNGFNVLFEKDEIDEALLNYNQNINPHQRHGVKGNLLQWRSMQKCLLMKQRMEIKVREKYDWVIWVRPDLYFFNALENLNNLKTPALYIPAHDNHLGGLMDRFAIGDSSSMDVRMDIFNYFTKEWYPKYHNDESRTFKRPDNSTQWNPELVLKSLIDEKLSSPIGKLNLCGGKVRDENFVSIPFWHEIYGNDFCGMSCSEDIVNPEVLRKIHKYKNCRTKNNSAWFEVQVEK